MKQIGFLAFLAVSVLSVSAFAQGEGKRRGFNRDRQQGGFNMERMLKALDKNGDGKLSQAEAPERMKDRFDQMDANGDGFVDAAELKKLAEMRSRRAGQKPGVGAGGAAKKKGARKGGESARPDFAGGRGGRMFDLAKLFKEMDADGDGNLNSKEQQAIIARVNEMQAKMREMMNRSGGQAGKKKLGDRYARPNTDPVKPKRPGMQD